MTYTDSFTWPTCRVEGCDAPAGRLITVYRTVGEDLPIPTSQRLARREGLCLPHFLQQQSNQNVVKR